MCRSESHRTSLFGGMVWVVNESGWNGRDTIQRAVQETAGGVERHTGRSLRNGRTVCCSTYRKTTISLLIAHKQKLPFLGGALWEVGDYLFFRFLMASFAR